MVCSVAVHLEEYSLSCCKLIPFHRCKPRLRNDLYCVEWDV